MPWCNAAKHSHAAGFAGQKGKMRLIYPPLTTITTPHTTQQQQLTITFTQIQNKHALNSTNSAQTHPQRGQHLEPDDVTAAAQLRLKRVITVVKVTRGDFNRWVYRRRATLNRRDTLLISSLIHCIWFMDEHDSWMCDFKWSFMFILHYWFYYLWSLKIT